MPVSETVSGEAVPVKSWAAKLDSLSREQLLNVAALPFVYRHVAAMPDVHPGIGATIGSVIATKGAVIPSAVGVDIGCGMMAARLDIEAGSVSPEQLQTLFTQITKTIPSGRNQYRDDQVDHEAADPFEAGLESLLSRHPGLLRSFGEKSKWKNQMGTLGSGNHFIEICRDRENSLWVMLHSGSRGVGNAIADYFIKAAREDNTARNIALPDPALAYFEEGTSLFNDYLEAVGWSQAYAMENRNVMMRRVFRLIEKTLGSFSVTDTPVNCHHNYVSRETHFGEDVLVTRKGAIRAGAGEPGIIPGSMGARSYIVSGKGEPESFCSSAHGAGRILTRTQAKKRFSVDDLQTQTSGILCRKDTGVLDEIPAAYKNIDEVMECQKDLVTVEHILSQLICVKG